MNNNNSILFGNGLDIQTGGDDYLNKWIIVRMLSKAKMNKYDCLFWNLEKEEPIITGDEIIEMLNNMITVANEIRANKYDKIIEEKSQDIIEAVADFKNNYTNELTSVEQIGMEDWILIFLLYLIKEKDLIGHYAAIKKGFECMILDSIYCEGTIQNLYQKIGTKAKKHFRKYDKIFTLNYDNSLEKAKIFPYHLHGAYESIGLNEECYSLLSPIMKSENIVYDYPEKMKHCNCSAILDFSGRRKYQYASEMTNINRETQIGYDYHFKELEELTGQLTIVGLASNNDKHIFDCINKSHIKKIIYYYFGKNEDKAKIELPIDKPYEIENVNNFWRNININKPHNSTSVYNIVRKDRNGVEKFLNIFNSFYEDKVTLEQVMTELQSIPVVTEKIILDMMKSELDKESYHETPSDMKDLIGKFVDFGYTLKTAAISPQTLYFLNMFNMK